MFDGLFRMRHHCADCSYVYDREQGYFLGAVYLNYGVTCALALALFFPLVSWLGGAPWKHLLYLIPLVIFLPLLLFRYSRLLWMALDLAFSPPADEDFLGPVDPDAVPNPNTDPPDQAS